MGFVLWWLTNKGCTFVFQSGLWLWVGLTLPDSHRNTKPKTVVRKPWTVFQYKHTYDLKEFDILFIDTFYWLVFIFVSNLFLRTFCSISCSYNLAHVRQTFIHFKIGDCYQQNCIRNNSMYCTKPFILYLLCFDRRFKSCIN